MNPGHFNAEVRRTCFPENYNSVIIAEDSMLVNRSRAKIRFSVRLRYQRAGAPAKRRREAPHLGASLALPDPRLHQIAQYLLFRKKPCRSPRMPEYHRAFGSYLPALYIIQHARESLPRIYGIDE